MAIFDLNGELLHYSVGPELLDALDLEVVGQPAMN
jgi:hypothetical protein